MIFIWFLSFGYDCSRESFPSPHRATNNSQGNQRPQRREPVSLRSTTLFGFLFRLGNQHLDIFWLKDESHLTKTEMLKAETLP
jgi:hypothetical protein